MFKKIFLGILLLLIIACGGAAFYVSTIDWNKYKGDIAQKFSELTGKDIKINGSVNISLLPHPSLKAHDVSVYNKGDEKNALASVKKIDMSVSLASVLEGTPDINSLSLNNAVIWVKQNEKGKLNWSFSGGEKSPDAGKTSLQTLSLQNATFHYENESADIKFDIKKINAEIQAAEIGGPYRMDGNFIKDNDHFAVAVGIGSLNSLDGIETNLSISHPASESYFRFDGMYNPQDHSIKGDFSGGSKKTAKFVNALSAMQILDEKNEQELQFSSGVESDAELLKLSSFVIKYGNDIEGSGSLTYPWKVAENQKRKIDIKYEFLNFDIRPFIPAVKAEYQQYKDNGGVYLPDIDFNISAELAAKHIDINEDDRGYLENITLKASWKDNILSIDEFYANSVGDTAISISGDLREENTRPKYFLKTSLISADFLSFANSFGADLKALAQSSYQNAKFDFSIVGDDGSFQMENAEFSMDKMKVNVDFSTMFMLEDINFNLNVVTDNLNFDVYLPNDEENREFMEQLQEDLKVFEAQKNWNGEISFSAENAVFRSTPISSLIIKLKNEKGIINIDEISAKKTTGADIKISGQVDFTQNSTSIQNMNLEIDAANISELTSQINLNLPKWKILKTKSFKMNSGISGSLSDIFTTTSMEIDGNTINYSGNIVRKDGTSFNGNLGIKTLNMGQFFDGIGVDTSSFPNKNSAFSCEGMVEADGESFSYKDLKCLLGTSNYSGNILVKKQDDKNLIDATINADEFNLSYLFDFKPNKTSAFSNETAFDNTFVSRPDLSRDFLNFDIYENQDITLSVSAQKGTLKRMIFDNLSFKMSNKDKILKLEDISTDYKNAHYSGNLSFSYNNTENPTLNGHLEFKDLDIGIIGGSTYMLNNGKLNGKADFESRGASAYELVSNISGDVSMNVTELNFKGFNLAAIQRDISTRKYSKGLFQAIRDNLQSGETQFDPFEVNIAMKNGTISVTNLALLNSSAQSDLSFEIDLKNWKINSKMIISLSETDNVPPFEVSLNGMLQKPSLEINIENIVKHYDSYWKEIEDKKNEEMEAKKQELNEKMAVAQSEAAVASSNINMFVPLIERYKQGSKKEENIAWYDSKLKEINLMNENIDSMNAKSRTTDFTDDDINSIRQRIKTYSDAISSWNDEISARRADDVEFMSNKITGEKNDILFNLQKLKSDYESKLADEENLLLKIRKDKQLKSDENLKLMIERFENFYSETELQGNKISDKLASLKSATSEEQKDITLLGSESMLKEMSAAFNRTKIVQSELIEQIAEVSKKLSDENKKANQDEESTADVDILKSKDIFEKNSGNSVEAEKGKLLKAVSDESDSADVPSQTEQNSKGIIIKSYNADDEQIKPQAPKKGLLRAVDGAVTKASGTIIVK